MADDFSARVHPAAALGPCSAWPLAHMRPPARAAPRAVAGRSIDVKMIHPASISAAPQPLLRPKL
ncbi:hypothetical protein IWW50_006436 [Coemansia erecta]|nr:hypothetical protein IWW50_006436 [Coemansia erecta]